MLEPLSKRGVETIFLYLLHKSEKRAQCALLHNSDDGLCLCSGFLDIT